MLDKEKLICKRQFTRGKHQVLEEIIRIENTGPAVTYVLKWRRTDNTGTARLGPTVSKNLAIDKENFIENLEQMHFYGMPPDTTLVQLARRKVDEAWDDYWSLKAPLPGEVNVSEDPKEPSAERNLSQVDADAGEAEEG